MMISDSLNKPGDNEEAYVWIWLPNEIHPIVAGKLSRDSDKIYFNYGRSYLERVNNDLPCLSVYEPELPLQTGELPLLNGLKMPNCIRDASPDAWGRRVIMNNKFGQKGKEIEIEKFGEMAYLLESGSDRIGALDFQQSHTEYKPRSLTNASLDELLEAANLVENGENLSPELSQALLHGSSIGGARPKSLIQEQDQKYIAKFSSSSDVHNMVKLEFIAMRLAELIGLNVAPVKLVNALNKDVLLIERFDRQPCPENTTNWSRRMMVSVLTILGLDEMLAKYASYETLAEIVRKRFTSPKKTLKELFSRLVFNILCGNTDDHARNHAAFWDGRELTLTPAYDIAPQTRAGNEASQAMLIAKQNRRSQLKTCLQTAHNFMLPAEAAHAIFDHQIKMIEQNWNSVCDEAELSGAEKNLFWKRQFLNPFSTER